jgi:nitric oxide synthase oxygenase domain/subunit
MHKAKELMHKAKELMHKAKELMHKAKNAWKNRTTGCLIKCPCKVPGDQVRSKKLHW